MSFLVKEGLWAYSCALQRVRPCRETHPGLRSPVVGGKFELWGREVKWRPVPVLLGEGGKLSKKTCRWSTLLQECLWNGVVSSEVARAGAASCDMREPWGSGSLFRTQTKGRCAILHESPWGWGGLLNRLLLGWSGVLNGSTGGGLAVASYALEVTKPIRSLTGESQDLEGANTR